VKATGEIAFTEVWVSAFFLTYWKGVDFEGFIYWDEGSEGKIQGNRVVYGAHVRSADFAQR